MSKKVLLVALLPFIIWGCSSSSRNLLVYETMPFDNGYSYFANGLPVASVSEGDKRILVTLEETELFSKKYVRAWVLVENRSDKPYLLEPASVFKLLGVKDSLNRFEFSPEAPSKILEAVDNKAASDMIFTVIGGTLRSIAAEDTKVTGSNGTVYSVNDREEKQNRIWDETGERLKNKAEMYDTFISSFNAGVLRKNTVFPGKSVNGYVYFPVFRADQDSNVWIKEGRYFDIRDLSFSFKINMDSSAIKLDYKPTEIW